MNDLTESYRILDSWATDSPANDDAADVRTAARVVLDAFDKRQLPDQRTNDAELIRLVDLLTAAVEERALAERDGDSDGRIEQRTLVEERVREKLFAAIAGNKPTEVGERLCPDCGKPLTEARPGGPYLCANTECPATSDLRRMRLRERIANDPDIGTDAGAATREIEGGITPTGQRP